MRRDSALGRERGVQQQRGAGAGVAEHVVAVEEAELVAGDEVGGADQVGRLERLGPKAQVADGDRAGLLAVVDEVALRVQVGAVAEDLDGVLVGADRAVGTQAEEHRFAARGVRQFEVVVPGERAVGDVVDDADGEAVARAVREHREHRQCHRRGEFLAGQAVAAADDLRALRLVAQRGDHVEAQRFGGGAGLLGAVEHGDAGGARRQRGDERGGVERAVQADLQQADAFAPRGEPVDGAAHGLAGGTHHDDDPVGVGRAVVGERRVVAAGLRREACHRGAHRGRYRIEERLAGFASLEEHVGVLGAAAQLRPVGGQRAAAVCGDRVVVDEQAQVVVGEAADAAHFVRGAEAVEEVHERHPALQRRQVRDAGQVLGLLHGRRTQHREAGLPHRHHVAVVAEDRQCVGRQGARGDVHDERGQLAGQLVHGRDHQQEALRGGERHRQRAGLQCAVHGAGSTPFALHLDDGGHAAEHVRQALGGPFVGEFAHRRRRRDRIDRRDFAEAIGDGGDGFVGVDGRGARGPRAGHGNSRPDGLVEHMVAPGEAGGTGCAAGVGGGSGRRGRWARSATGAALRFGLKLHK